MNNHSCSTSGRGVSCPPAFLSSRGRRPAREIATRELRSEWSISKPGLVLPPPTGTAADPSGTLHTDGVVASLPVCADRLLLHG